MWRILAAACAAVLIPACGEDSDGGTPFVPETPDEGDSTAAVGEAPHVRIVTPGPRTQVHAGATINVQAIAIDPDAEIVRVEFFDGTEPIGGRWTAPFIVPWAAVTPGTHFLTAVALDVEGRTAVSASVTVLVKDGDRDDDDGDDDDDRPPGPTPRRR